jgi:hypothetical protein
MQRGKKIPQKQGHISPTKYEEKNITRIDVITLYHSLKKYEPITFVINDSD